MTTIAIMPETGDPAGGAYRAVAGNTQSVGKTPGEALDALTAQLDESESGTLVVVQQLRPDRYFTREQQDRLADLMRRWRTARDTGQAWSTAEQTELNALVEAELRAATERAAALVRQLAS
jgi:hypothetical protein